MASSRVHYSAKFKRKVIEVALATDNNVATAGQFQVSEANVRRWLKQRNDFMDSSRKAFRGPKRGRHPEVEPVVADFVKEQRSKRLAVTAEMIQAKAREVARHRGIPHGEFKASRGWVERFMKRAGFSLRRRTSVCQRLPADFEEKLVSFQRYVLKLRQEHGYMLSQIGNADQTPIYFDMPISWTVDSVGAKDVKVRTTGIEKQRMTVMLACTADGKRLPPFIIFARKTLPKNERFSAEVIVRCNEKGWMTADMFNEWLRLVWFRRPGALLSPRSILVVDSFKGHTTDSSKSELLSNKCDLVVILGGMTSQLQPLDVCINKPVKDRVLFLFIHSFESSTATDWISEDEHELTPTGRLKRAPLSTLVQWVTDAWREAPDDIVVRAFKKCGISNALDGTKDDFLWDESDKENSFMECNADE